MDGPQQVTTITVLTTKSRSKNSREARGRTCQDKKNISIKEMWIGHSRWLVVGGVVTGDDNDHDDDYEDEIKPKRQIVV